jgi:hypothetical protein
MSKEDEIPEEFSRKTTAILQKETEKEGAKKQRIFEITQEFNHKIIALFTEIGKTTEKIGAGSEAWRTKLQNHFVKGYEERKMSEINTLDGVKNGVGGLQSDLSLVLSGFGNDGGYRSLITELRTDLSKTKGELEEQKQLAENETKQRKDLEENFKTIDTNTSKERIKSSEESLRSAERAKELLRNYIDSFFDSGFLTYFLKEISKFDIKGINIDWDEKGVDYILSSEFYSLANKKDLLKFIEAKGKVEEAKLSDVTLREQYKELFEKLSVYMQDSKHLSNLRRVWKDVSEAKRTLDSRRSKKLVWCGDYSKNCYSTCIGFTPGEPYCSVEKKTPYDSTRLNLISYLMDELCYVLRVGIGLENKLSEWKK